MKLKIAIYSGVVPSTTFIERLIIGLAESGSEVYLFGDQQRKAQYGKNIIVSTYGKKFSKLWVLVRFSVLLWLFKSKEKRELDSWISSRNRRSLLLKVKCYPVLWYAPEIFHLQWARSVEDWLWVQDFGMKLVISFRGAHINYTPITEEGVAELYLKYFPKVDGFHAVSSAIAKEAVKYGANPEKIKVVYSGFPLTAIPSHVDMYTQEIKTIQLLSIGRSHWVKGYNYALDACYLLKQQGIDFHYTIIGAKGVEELEYQRSELNLIDQITFLDRVPYEEVLDKTQQAHIILLPSVEEGIANVVLEAMMLQKLVLTTDCGGMEEIVKDGQNGFVVPIRNPQQMSEKIMQISELSPSQIKEITTQARITIETINSEQKMVADMKSLYDFVLNPTSYESTSK